MIVYRVPAKLPAKFWVCVFSFVQMAKGRAGHSWKSVPETVLMLWVVTKQHLRLADWTWALWLLYLRHKMGLGVP